MDSDSRFIITPRLILGLGIALVGVALTLDRLLIVDAGRILRFWPVGLILLGGVMIVQGDGRDRTRGIVFAAVGTWLFLNFQGLLTVSMRDLFLPVILIIIGTNIALRRSSHRSRRHWRHHTGSRSDAGVPGGESVEGAAPFDRVREPIGAPDPAAHISMFSVMSGVRRASNATAFRGGDILAFMGGVHLDLRLATIPPGAEAVLDVTAIMGGVEVAVPSNWAVSTPVFPFMGAVEDKRLAPLPIDGKPVTDAPRLIIRGFVMMGNIELRS